MTEIATGTHQKPLRPKIALRGSRGVYKRGTTWVAIAELPPGATGERRRRWSGGHRTRKKAERALVAQRNEIANGIDIAPSRLRVDAYLRRWLLSVRPSVQPRTFDLYESVVRNRLIPSLGGHLLDRLSPLIIQETIANWASGARADGREGRLSARSVSLAFTVLKITLTQVVRWNLIARNACAGLYAITAAFRVCVLDNLRPAPNVPHRIRDRVYIACGLTQTPTRLSHRLLIRRSPERFKFRLF